MVSHFNPHTPYEGHPQRYLDLYRNVNFTTFGVEPKAPNALREAEFMNDPIPALRRAAASTTALDDPIPPLLEALERAGQRDNTLIMFVGDNGFLYGRHGAWSKGWAQNPIVMYEEVVRVLMIFNWPGVLRGRQMPDGLRAEGFAAEIIQAIECLARRTDETYDEFIERAKTSPVAWRVKVADLDDNLNIRRIETLMPKDLERLEKYHRAWRALNS